MTLLQLRVVIMLSVICPAIARAQSDLASLASVASDTAGVADTSNHRVVGDLRILELRSRIFNNTRKIRVLLPADYDAPANRARTYPVLYLNDGQNLFDSATALFGPMEWRVDETVARLESEHVIPPIIVVGIDNAGRAGRAHEYLPYPDEYLSPPDAHPQGKDYPAFLVREVIPLVRRRFRVAHDRSHVGIGGSSYGAVAALYAATKHPGVFGLLLIESPSLYVDSAQILRDVRAARLKPSRTYIGVGTNEEGKPDCDPASKAATEAETDVHRLERALAANGVTASRLKLVVAPCAIHNEAAWAARLPSALQFLFVDHSADRVHLRTDR